MEREKGKNGNQILYGIFSRQKKIVGILTAGDDRKAKENINNKKTEMGKTKILIPPGCSNHSQ